jgi:hypothetical protein
MHCGQCLELPSSNPHLLASMQFYVACEYVKPGVKPSPTLRLVTQASHHRGCSMVVWPWALIKGAPTLEGLPRRACHLPSNNRHGTTKNWSRLLGFPSIIC